ncbi:MAG: hypothetical protein A2Z16_11940 [Chloroflexi bacterium RBG_16_54_18]|nr:MAG: hypothetical protein A2Z16_11940 [Chloroflexi bacterium RBG_16_54_18]
MASTNAARLTTTADPYSMLVLLPPALLFLNSLLVLTHRFGRLKPAIYWLAGFAGALAAWVLVLFLHSRIPISFTLPSWQPSPIFSFSPQFILNDYSWPYAASITTLCLVGLMVSLVNQSSLVLDQSGWKEWAAMTAISAISLLAVYPGDLLTLIVTWTVVDFVEFGTRLWSEKGSQSSLKPVILLTSRLAGTLLAVWAAVLSLANGYPLALQSLQTSIIPLLLIALGIRMCVLPLNLLRPSIPPTHKILAILLLLAPQATNLVALARIASLSVPVSESIWLLGIALVLLFTSLVWFFGTDEYQGRGFWLVACSGLALAASSQALPGASLAWALALQLSGALWMMASFHIKALKLFLVIGGLSISSLPFTLTWQGVWMYGSPMGVAGWIFLVSQLLLLAGYLRFALQKRQDFPYSESWKVGMYFISLLLLVIMTFVIYALDPLLSGSSVMPTIRETGPAFLLAVLCLAGWTVSRRIKHSFSRLENLLNSIINSNWSLHAGKLVFEFVSKIFPGVNFVLEGQAGVLWAFLIFILLVSIMSQIMPGG